MKIQVADLKFSYGPKQVLGVSRVDFEPGNIYAIVGKNGVGKTTFFKTLTNIITNYSGYIHINGESVRDNPHVLSDVGIVLDDMELYKNKTGMFNLHYFGGLRGGFNETYALRLAEELEIAPALEQKVAEYSLGMSKKLILLISLMNAAQILIFDEPFRGLDKKSVDWFRRYLLYLKSQNRMILISSHIQEDIEALADRVLVMMDGDFRSEFDLKDTNQIYEYSVEVNNQEMFMRLLEDSGIAFVHKEKMIGFRAQEASYKEIFRIAVANGVEFYQIKKESQFARFVK